MGRRRIWTRTVGGAAVDATAPLYFNAQLRSNARKIEHGFEARESRGIVGFDFAAGDVEGAVVRAMLR